MTGKRLGIQDAMRCWGTALRFPVQLISCRECVRYLTVHFEKQLNMELKTRGFSYVWTLPKAVPDTEDLFFYLKNKIKT